MSEGPRLAEFERTGRAAEEQCLGSRSNGFGGSGIDDAADLRDAVGREAALARMLPYHLLVGRDVNAVNLVVGDVALQPLDLRAEIGEHRAGLLRDGLN